MNSIILTQFGDYLDGIDCVQERNGVGFNKFDKFRWRDVRGNEAAMKKMLLKYRKQLADQFGSIVDSIDWDSKEVTSASVEVTALENGSYGLRLTSESRIEKSRFTAFIDYVKSQKARCDVNAGYIWIVPQDFDFEAFRNHLTEHDITLMGIPEPKIALEKKEGKITPVHVVVNKNDVGNYEVYHPFSEKLNGAYRNAEETSGVIGFDWNKKCRIVGKDQIKDLEEILEVIKRYYPEWNVGFRFDFDSEKKRIEDEHSAMRTDDSVATLMNEGFKPLPYQIEGYKFYEQLNGCALNGDDMGLGKTLQTLIYAARNNKRMIVVCPKNVRRQWIQEAKKFFKPEIFSGLELNSKSKVDSLDGYNLVTVNYEIIDRFTALIENSNFDLLVLDESHRIKNAATKTTRLIMGLRDKFQHRICLSGTPIKNKKRELFTQANLISPNTFKSENEILMSSNFNVREKMKSFFFRRTKKQELKDLPEKFRSIVPIEAKKLPDLDGASDIGDVSRIKSALAQAKAKYTCEFVKDILENSDSKVIVFSDSDDAATEIAKHFGVYAVLHVGATSHERREKAKEIFNDENSSVRVFVATTGSAREGLNLTVADKVVFNDLPWTPADLNQAESRAHRLGQKNCVNVYWMQVDGNVFDMKSVQILNDKMKIYEAVINGKKLTKEEQDIMKRNVAEVLTVKKMLGV
jgi:SWI/SNF-related matrix-associated actin-dependent regulator 1 of chromatin subfamily A